MSKSKRKIEAWSTQIFGNSDEHNEKYDKLKGRELAILAAAVMDIGLAHAIEKKIRNDQDEVQGFLGLNGDGRAPIGTFGARIQMAYLLGIISKGEMEVYRAIKKIRNHFAHTVNAQFMSLEILKDMNCLIDKYFDVPIGNKSQRLEYAKQVKSKLDNESCESIYRGVFKLEILVLDYRIESSERMEMQRDRPSKYARILNRGGDEGMMASPID
jgi:hypothetical protein